MKRIKAIGMYAILFSLSVFEPLAASLSYDSITDASSTNSLAIENEKSYIDSLRAIVHKPVREVHYDISDLSGTQTSVLPSATNLDVNTHVPTSVEIDTSREVGEIPIVSGTSQTGSKTYSVAIDTPAGMNGFMPGLSISYDSQRGNTVLGKGWAISGITYVARTGRNLYHDKTTSGITMTNEDGFTLDGVRLIPIQTGENSTTYQSEQGNIKVKSHIYSSVLQYFEVFYPDGNKGVFGFPDARTNQVVYPIISLTDLHGNSIEYEYTLSKGIYHISRIAYNGMSVEFSYISRNDDVLSYTGGIELIEDKLLQSIVCKVGDTTLKTYTFSYSRQTDRDDSPVNILLTGIESAAGGKLMNPLRFYYGTGTSSDGYEISETMIMAGYESEDPNGVKYVKGRFDYRSSSDGLIILPNYIPFLQDYEVDTKSLKVKKNRFVNLYDGTENIYIYTGLDNDVAMPMPSLKTGNGFTDILCADIMGQQEEYIVKVNNYVENKRDKLVFSVYSSTFLNGLVNVYTRTYDMGEAFKDAGGVWSVYPKFHYAGDFNGDGRMEILSISADQPFGSSSRYSECTVFDLADNRKLFEGSLCLYYVNFAGTRQNNPEYIANHSDKLFILDYDGDGKTDICHINNGGMTIYTFDTQMGSMTPKQIAKDSHVDMEFMMDRELLCGEFNGDGLMDLLVSPSKKDEGIDWQLFFSKGNGTFAKGEFHGIRRKKSERDSFIIQDIDGDGRTDLVRCDSVSLTTFLTRKNIPSTEVFKTFGENTIIVPTNINSHNRFTQLIGINKGTVTRYAFQRNSTHEGLLTGMANSHGIIERNDYVMLNDPGAESEIYIKGYDAVFPYVNIVEAIPVLVSSETSLCGNSNDRSVYRYTDAIFHRQGKGFCGFSRIERISNLSGRQIREYDPYMYGVIKLEQTPKHEVIYGYQDLTGSNRIAKVYLISRIEKDILKDFTVTTSYNSYDTHGFPMLEETVYSDGSTVRNNYAYVSSAEAADGYSLGFMRERTTTITRNGKTYVEHINIPAYDKRLPKVKVLYKDNNQVEQVTTLHDTHGNPVSETVKRYSSPHQLQTLYAYDTSGRMVSKTYPTGLSETFSYDHRGLPASVKDIRGETTTFAYDGFGRLASVSHPDSTSRSVAYRWSSEAGSLYAVTVRQTGRPDTTVYYDALNREVRCEETRLDGSLKKIDRRYDARGNLWKVSLPFKTGEPDEWNVFTYDIHDRLIKSAEATGRTTTYTYSGSSETEDDGQKSTTRRYDVFGNIVSVTDPSGTATYGYAADGQLSEITTPGNVVTTIGYDKYRRRTSVNDPSLGETTYTYDTSGNIATHTDADGRTVSNTYDKYGRIINRECEELTASYEYDAYGQLMSVSADNGTGTAYSYDKHGRVRELLEEGPDSVWLRRSYVYRSGNVSAVSYTSDKGRIATETRTYSNGHLREVILDNRTVIYRLNGENSFGQPTVVLTGPVTRRYVHTGYAYPFKRTAETEAGTIQDQGYLFDPKTGNMLSRTDNTRSLKETFTYDSRNRLTGYGGTAVSYDNNGNILNKGDAGRFSYGVSGKPYAVSGLTPATGVSVPSDTQEMSFTSLSRPSSITEGDVTAEFDYDADGDRVRMTVTKDGMRSLTRHYIGDRYERERKGLYLYERLYLGGDAYSAPAVIERTVLAVMSDTIKLEPIGPLEPVKPAGGGTSETNTTSMPWQEAASIEGTRVYYLLRDCLGSVTHIVSSDGKVVQELSYDAWGRMRNPDTHATYSYGQQHTPRFGRGYTGHEHLPWFGLINMNARLYDPLTGRFLSPDPNVQDPFWLQNLNRYTYAMNNPLCYIDEDGEFVMLLIGGALIGGGINVITKAISGQLNSFADGLAAFGIGALAGGIGAAAGGWAFGVLGGAAGGLGGFIAGAGSGAVGTAVSAPILNYGNNICFGDPIMSPEEYTISIISGAIIGGVINGTIASINGKNFWNGSCEPEYSLSSSSPFSSLSNGNQIDPYNSTPGNSNSLSQPVPKELIHYTTKEGYESIWQTKQLKPSLNLRHAHYGEGQYLTDLEPSLNTKSYVLNQLFRSQWPYIKVQYYLRINVTGLNVIRNTPHNFVIPGTTPLDLTGRIRGGGISVFRIKF